MDELEKIPRFICVDCHRHIHYYYCPNRTHLSSLVDCSDVYYFYSKQPENIMLVNPSSNQVKLIDFGLARKYNPNETMQALCGTPEFVGMLCCYLDDVLYVI